jgi:hypothetical protein
MTDPLSAYIHRSWLVDSDGVLSEGVNKTANYVWDTGTLAWVKSTGSGGGGGSVTVSNFPAVQPVSLPTTAKRYDQVDATTAYLGDAAVGSGTASAVWRIQKLAFTTGGSVTITWANGASTFANVWDNRASLSYS